MVIKILVCCYTSLILKSFLFVLDYAIIQILRSMTMHIALHLIITYFIVILSYHQYIFLAKLKIEKKNYNKKIEK